MSPVLHPSVRERIEPRISATALADYLIKAPPEQNTILQDSRFASAPLTTANGAAMRALRAYNTDPRRDHSSLDRVKEALDQKALDLTLKPRNRDEARRCSEILTLFDRCENALGTRRMPLYKPPTLAPVVIEGVTVSIRPDLCVKGDRDRIGAAMIRVAKNPDPFSAKMPGVGQKREDRRRDMAHYLIAMMQLLLESQREAEGIPDPSLCFVADVRLGERIDAASDHTARIRAVRGACVQIARLWPTVQPRPSLLTRHGSDD